MGLLAAATRRGRAVADRERVYCRYPLRVEFPERDPEAGGCAATLVQLCGSLRDELCCGGRCGGRCGAARCYCAALGADATTRGCYNAPDGGSWLARWATTLGITWKTERRRDSDVLQNPDGIKCFRWGKRAKPPSAARLAQRAAVPIRRSYWLPRPRQTRLGLCSM